MLISVTRRVRAGVGVALMAVVAGLLACVGQAAGLEHSAKGEDVSFKDIALDIGFQDRLSHGRAIVVADFNNDGLTDFYLGNPGDPLVADDDSFIFWNEGQDEKGQYHFRKGQILIKGDIAFTASAADYDNDGDEDLFVGIGGQEGVGLDHLFRNSGGVFTDVSARAGIRGPKSPDGRWIPTATSSGTWADYDNDGDLDLFVASRNVPQSLHLPNGLGWRDSLFRNNGDGTFTDVTRDAGVGSTASSMTSAWGDYDNDGWMDLYIPVGWPDLARAGFELYRNMHDGTFQRVPLQPQDVSFGDTANWSSTAADFNNDGWLDILSWARSPMGLVEDSHALLINHGGWSFSNDAIATGLAIPGEPTPRVMGGQVGDYDNDGYLDVVMANGGPELGGRDDLFRNTYKDKTGLHFEKVSSLIDYPAPADPQCVSPPVNPKYLWANQVNLVDSNMMIHSSANDASAVDCGSGVPRPLEEGMDLCNPPYPYRGHGVVFFDLDGDGDLDLFMSKGGTRIVADSVEPNRVFRNDGGNDKSWLDLNLTGTVSNRDAVGSRVKLVATKNGDDPLTLYREVYGGSGFSADAGHEIHFGLAGKDKVDEIEITWPSGIHTVLRDVEINQRVSVSEDVLLGDTFNDGRAPGWVPVSGEWSVGHDEYRQTGAGRAFSVNSKITRADSTVVAKLTYRSGAAQMGLLARMSADGLTGYELRLNGTHAQLFKSVDGQRAALGSPMIIEPMTPGRSYIASLTCEGDSLSWSVDGKEGSPVTDSSIASGAIGVDTVDTLASFDNIAVY